MFASINGPDDTARLLLVLLTHLHEKLVPLVGLPESLLHWLHHSGAGHAQTRIAETHNTSG